MQQVVIFDIDGTLSNSSHRLKYIKDNKDWVTFFEHMGEDPIVENVAEMYHLLESTGRFEMIIVSGRPERYRKSTIIWLKKNGIKYHRLFLRQEGDFRSDAVVKNEFLNQIKKHYEVKWVFDDRSSAVEMWRKNGVFCFQCPEL